MLLATRGPMPQTSAVQRMQSRQHFRMFIFAALKSFERELAYTTIASFCASRPFPFSFMNFEKVFMASTFSCHFGLVSTVVFSFPKSL